MSSEIPPSSLDHVLALQLIVAWAGERGDPDDADAQRLGWWRSDLINEFGGGAYFAELLPRTGAWAALQAAREAARRHEASRRAEASDPTSLITLFHLGFTTDERLDTRLQELKRSGRPPSEALPQVRELVDEDNWSPETFADWLTTLATPGVVVDPIGRRVRGTVPSDPLRAANLLAAALVPLAGRHPLPHMRRGTQ